jgi:hypothetical protein
MTVSKAASPLGSVVPNLKAAYDELKKLSAEPAPPPKPDDRSSKPPPSSLAEDDRQQLSLFADEVDDVLRRVAALQVRMDRS